MTTENKFLIKCAIGGLAAGAGLTYIFLAFTHRW